MTATYPSEAQPQSRAHGWPGLIEAYRDYLPVTDTTPIVTLHEGNTPLIPVPTIAREIGRGVEVFVKYDGLNPTGSFKDRGMTMAITKAKEAGAKAVICASTGNTSAAAAAYARRGGLRAFVLIPDGFVAQGKLAQALLYGAEVLAIKGNFDRALEIVREVANQYPVTLVNSLNPYRLEGQKTAAFELIDVLGEAPDWLCIPMGNAGNISAYWMGFQEYHAKGLSQKLPRMMGFQAAGSAPLVTGEIVQSPDTIATAIRIGNPANWQRALRVHEESNGAFNAVTDAEILDAYRMLAGQEGIFCEPASAASVAGMLKCKDEIPDGATIVCVLTGNGLKDPSSAIEFSHTGFKAGIEPDLDIVAHTMGF
ncbi:threonine synthase [Synechococcus elongatus]|uniref:Threonine synthase n=2 Tax=Synechococcus elongatus TaxID=32046 RepID=Q31JX7_SYNE7|nr:threonine synthase [Synechococcus elongatus]MBD2688931.1 threonine synthase [Synechococcus elongatus FACHB-1061]ABB58642.1 L-threonine synthase [Synechococcus elongatus PCC 7942 = FACHB-805]AJD56905.1 Threonine synthase [Synechococcus elongatus UTEX 2973]MBD2587863.1 threonine synthase [Synechococcus elongatus FACHB-242]MBD2707429.1 threonine synthase [Synechococcus elongatus PCC 7942 = FACHB-805]